MAVFLRFMPYLVIAYAVATISLFWLYQRTRLYPLYVLKVLWISCTVLAFAWVVAMSGGKNEEYIRKPSGPLEVLVGAMTKNDAGRNELRGGYPESLRTWYGLSPVGAVAILAGAWMTWGVVAGAKKERTAKRRAAGVESERSGLRAMLEGRGAVLICALLNGALLVMVFLGAGRRDGVIAALVLGGWIAVAARSPDVMVRFGGWAMVGMLAVLLLPLIPAAVEFDWSRYSYFGDNYRTAWVEGHIGQYFVNSLMVTVTTVSLTLLTGALAAYTIARQTFAGRGLLYALVIGGITVPGILIQVPLFLLVKDWGFAVGQGRYAFMDSRLGLSIIYASISLPFTIFVLTGFFRTLPTELAEAACIDGCSRWDTFRVIYLPLALPGLATTGIFNFLGAWNEFNLGMIFMSNPNFKTLPIGLYELQVATQYSSAWAPLFAGIVLLCLPTFLIFVFLQERIVAGMTAGASKG